MNEHEAAEVVVATITRMAEEGRPLMARVLPVGEAHFWAHYPDDDARDSMSRSRWYYHVHAPGERDPAEHGHFHLFLHRTQLDDPGGFLAAPAEGEDAPAHVTHIAGLSVDRSGVPLAWFATNRWVTDEFLYPADTMIAHLDRYDVDNTEEDGLVNRFLTAMVTLYRTELADLLRRRDLAQAELVASTGIAAYEADNDVLATCPIDLDAKIDSLGLE
ncbi:DUF6969 family protein [Rhizorhabdus dicambivorans]|uniref:DUF6969 domain-containing protein n=1 Tax=Rhizorhabdus dicambivorans TaxID=1850238 RepID=A0A2A4FRM8_9SPHN|nr:hypothetical protein [Rhizorhabdus dicambivorans]ATE66837.1 hypothetical protein CMV14_22470 [Rhizorhabdus dicambivorans]PCE40827.1 hypothetical protein COO09_18405 [Rhizorhabdus dicambivorans]